MVAARKLGGRVGTETMDEIDEELTKVTEDFLRAVDVEALNLAKNTGTHSLSQPGNSSSSIVSRRASTFAWAAQSCRDRLFTRPSLHRRHTPVYPYTTYDLGDQWTSAEGRAQYLLDLRLTRNRQIVDISFNLCTPPRGKAPCWSVFLPEGRPEFKGTQKYPSDTHLQTRHNLPPFSRCCGTEPS